MTQTLPLAITAPLSKAQRASLRNLITRAAQTEIMPRFRTLMPADIDTKTHAADLVTEADRAAEAMITRGLQRAFPNAVIVGEEMAETDPDYREKLAQAELAFIIDPVDGTWNFAHGLAVFGVIVAACRFGRPIFGMIYDPVGRDFIWADVDTPATWITASGHDRKVSSAGPKPLSEMIGFVQLSSMPHKHRIDASLKGVDIAHVAGLHCSAHHYRTIAQGTVDFSISTELKPWDHAAGVLIVQKAGGHAAMLDGSDYTAATQDGYLLCAGSRETWDVVAEHFAVLQEPAEADARDAA